MLQAMCSALLLLLHKSKSTTPFVPVRSESAGRACLLRRGKRLHADLHDDAAAAAAAVTTNVQSHSGQCVGRQCNLLEVHLPQYAGAHAL